MLGIKLSSTWAKLPQYTATLLVDDELRPARAAGTDASKPPREARTKPEYIVKDEGFTGNRREDQMVKQRSESTSWSMMNT